MADDVVLNKAASIERCVARAREEYEAHTGCNLQPFTAVGLLSPLEFPNF